MTQLQRLKRRIPDEPDDGVLEEMLESAKNVILVKRFPYGNFPTKTIEDEDGKLSEVTILESRYLDLQIRIAESIYLKQGGQYEISHSENNVSRSWASEGVPESLLQEIVPMVSVIN